MVKFTIPGEPKGKGRPRVTRYGAYTPETTVNYENWVKICFQEAKQVKLEGQLKAEIRCYFDIPNSYSKKKKEDALRGNIRPAKKPDLDNIMKIILDALNGLAYRDDKDIIECRIEKWYGDEARVEVEIKEAA